MYALIVLTFWGAVGFAEHGMAAPATVNGGIRVLAKETATIPATRYAGMKRIATGGQNYLMGFATGADNSWSCVMGQHKVTFTHDIYVDTTLVTQTDFNALMVLTRREIKAAPWAFRSTRKRGTMPYSIATPEANAMVWIPFTHIRPKPFPVRMQLLYPGFPIPIKF